MEKGRLDMNFQPFNYQDFQEGVFWLLIKREVYDHDEDQNGDVLVIPTGEEDRLVIMGDVGVDDDGFPLIQRVHSELGEYDESSDRVLMFAKVEPPVFSE